MRGTRKRSIRLILPLILGATTAAADPIVIVHTSGTAVEDGNPEFDADTTANQVTWDGDAIHVVSGVYQVGQGLQKQTLKIQAGASVKIAGSCTTSNGDIESCTAPNNGNGAILTQDGSVLQIDGAHITDIRDDTIGGDTNKDGNASTPTTAAWVRFGGEPNELLTHSDLNYMALVGHFGSMSIDNNVFAKSGGLGLFLGSGQYNTYPPVKGGVPRFTHNQLEINTGTPGPGTLDVRGTSAIVDANQFTGDGVAVTIGPAYRKFNDHAATDPEAGVTVVSSNIIQTKFGVRLEPAGGHILLQQPFRAQIRGNSLEGPASAQVGIAVQLPAQITVEHNSVDGYATPFSVTSAEFPLDSAWLPLFKDFVAHDNNFYSQPGAQGPMLNDDTIWQRKTYLNVEKNYWGSITGPHDTTNVDGLVNPHGEGLPIGHGFDYSPFAGQRPVAATDDIHIQATTDPAPPLVRLDSFSVNVTVDSYHSSTDGTIRVLVRDSGGVLLNPPGTTVQAPSSGHDAVVPQISIAAAPEFTNDIQVEAILISASGNEIRSNVVSLPVRPVGTSFVLGCISKVEAGLCDPIPLIPGKTETVSLRFLYESPDTNVDAHVELQERVKGTGEVLADYDPVDFTLPSSLYGSHGQDVAVNFPLADALTRKPRELYVTYYAEDGDGRIGQGSRSAPVLDDANSVYFVASPLDAAARRRGYMLAGEIPRLAAHVSYTISTEGVVGSWQIAPSYAQAIGASGNVLANIALDDNNDSRLKSLGTGSATILNVVYQGGAPLPAGTRAVRIALGLFATNKYVGLSGTLQFPVRDSESFVEKPIPAGLSETSFGPIPIKLTFTSNSQPGTVAVNEFSGNADAALPAGAASLQLAAPTVEQEELVPIDRYWSIYGTLVHGSFSGTLELTYDPEADFPDVAGFDEDALVIAALNPNSGELEELPSTLNKLTHTLTTVYDDFYETWTIASKIVPAVAACADPTADGKTTAADALFALRASVGSQTCDPCICDVNKNGTVTSSDALVMLRFAVGQVSAPTCNPCA